jgi:hypothetical protein
MPVKLKVGNIVELIATCKRRRKGYASRMKKIVCREYTQIINVQGKEKEHKKILNVS